MNNEQLERASDVINNDATAHSSYFEADGGSCAVGGLYMSLHPEDSFSQLVTALGNIDTKRFGDRCNQVHYEVGEAFGLSNDEIERLTTINDRFEPDDYEVGEEFPHTPDDFLSYGQVDYDSFADAESEWADAHQGEADNEMMVHDRRIALIAWLTDLVIQD
jgi:hypothetical protein